ncbi:MAG: cadherin-like domain-containing protein [Acidobacteria bacterium]|nr:cadherin-like domain-containing protein [Acidobacteriota bacterium]
MKYTHPRFEFRSSRTFVANLLAFLLLTSQFAPLAAAQSARGGARGQQPAKVQGQQSGKAESGNGGEKQTSPDAAQPSAVTITATKTDNIPQTQEVSPGATINYTVTVTNNGSDPATGVTFTDTPGANTTLVDGSISTQPIANPDAYNVIGNVSIVPNATQGLLANDCDPDNGAGCTSTGLTASGPNSGPTNGQVTINSDGSFTYNPNPGYSGSDSFTYTVTDGDGKTDTATATLTVSTPIWFVKADAAAGGDGRLATPFNCYTGTNCFSDTAADEAGDAIFLFAGNYTGGYALLANQKLVGAGATASLASIHNNVTVEPYSTALPTTNGTPAVVVMTTTVAATNAVIVSAGGIVLRGFTVGATTGAKIFGTAFGTLTAGNNVSPDVVLNGAGQAINLTNGTFAANSGFVSVATTSAPGAPGITLTTVGGTVSFGTTAVSGAGSQGINISGSAVNATFGDTTVSAATQGILIGTSTGNIAFGATTVTGGTDGISLQNNSGGLRTFASITRTGGSATGILHGAGGGATTVTGATDIQNPAGIGISVNSSNANLSFGATTVNKSTTAGTGVSLISNASRTISFSSLTVTTSNGTGFLANSGGAINTSGGSISATGGPSLDMGGVALGLNFSSLSSLNSGTFGLFLNATSGAITTTSTGIDNPNGAGMSIAGATGGPYNFGNTTVTGSGNTGVDLGTNSAAITFADLDINPDANRRAFHSVNSTGTITATSGDVQATGNVTLEITGASTAARTPLAMTLNNLDSTNSTGLGVELNFVSGNLTVNDGTLATNITNAGNGVANTGIGIRVQNTASGTINFGNTTVGGSGSTGVVLTNNDGSITFGALTITPDGGQRGLLATDNDGATTAGAITAASGTVTTTNNTAVEITGASNTARTPLNFRLTTVNTTGAGQPNGIRLLNTSATSSPGGFRVLGNGGTCTSATPTCTGGQIATTTGGDGATGGAGIRLDNVDTASFTRMRLNDHPNYAIRGVNVNGFTLDASVINGTNGTNPGGPFNEGSINFDGGGAAGLAGSSSITNSDIRGGRLDNLRVDNSTGTFNLTITGSTFRDTFNAADASDNIFIEVDNSATGIVSITGSTFGETSGDHINFALINNAVGHVTITGNTMTGSATANRLGQGILVVGGTWDGVARYNISNNTMSGTKQGHAIHTNKGSGNGNMQGTISGNTIGVTGVAESGASESSGITVASRGAGGLHTAAVTNNTVRQYDEFGINLEVGEDLGVANNADAGATSGPAAALNVTVTGNLAEQPGPNALHGIHLNSGIQIGDNNVSCVDIGGAGALVNNVPTSANEAAGGADIRPRQRQATRVNLPGYAGTPFDTTAVNAYLLARNIATTVTASANNATGTTNDGFFGGAACAQPAAPTLPTAPAILTDKTDGQGETSAKQQQFIPVAAPQAAPFVGQIGMPVAAVQPAPDAAIFKAGAGKVADARAEGRKASLTKSAGSGKQIITPRAHDGTVHVEIGTLNPGNSVQITFSVTVNSPFPSGVTSVSNQGRVFGTNFTLVNGITTASPNTDDPDSPAANDPTVTLVLGPPDVAIKDASTGEPASGTTHMAFTVALTHAFNQNVTVAYATADGGANPATGGANCGDPNVDYKTTSGTLTFLPGQTVQTVSVEVCSDGDTAETNETLLVNLSTPSNASITDGAATGTINAVNTPGEILISEIRTSGPNGLEDDFVELYNNSDADVLVPAGGWGLFKMGASCADTPALVATVPASTNIPARGHYLITGAQYSLTATAAGDQSFAQPLGEDSNVGLFSTVDPLLLSSDNRLDAVGFGTNTGNNCDLLSEGALLSAAAGSVSEHSFARKLTTGLPKDTNDNTADFILVSTTPAVSVGSNLTPIIGAPGTENLASPIQRNAVIKASLIDPTLPSTAPPNRVRSSFGANPTNAAFGTLSIQRRFKNTLGVPVTRLRFRIVDLTTINNRTAGDADLRVLSSTGAVTNSAGTVVVTVNGLTLEPPTQPNGGGLNSTLTVVLPGGGLAPGNTIDVQFLLGVQEQGGFRFFVNVEALPGLGAVGEEATGATKSGTTAKQRNADAGGAAKQKQ